MEETDKKLWGRNLLISVLREHSNLDEIDALVRVRLLGLSNGQLAEHLRMEGLHLW